ncbi:unnamed protein product [Ambrosiozyma monospora]|uniref:Unnamed protein product n=1 Tax=Ambrosiozyma monospora TaxID=43982 RepID=A0ACB5SW78_AMBMO|nr:unnamed protein product [Ambrosiozyma monospora]
MGRLVGLELQNFKSYRGTASIGFGSSFFTSIIGPNGSGKSNMMDAISFVLGIRSNHLRSTNLKDLIYRGRVMEKGHEQNEDEMDQDDDEKEDEEEPKTAYVMAIYEKSNGDILKLKRTINASGSSDYNINGQAVTATQYGNILKAENILIKARNFLVFQGDVEKIASQSSTDLTKLIETISGSIELKSQYDSLSESKEKAHDETALKNSKKRTLREELNQYRNQCAEVEQFDRKFRELSKLIQSKYLTRLHLQEVQMENNASNLEESKEKLLSLNSEVNKLEAQLLKIKKRVSSKDQACRKIDGSIQSSSSVIRTKELNLIPINSEIPQVAKRISHYESRIKTIESDKSDQAEVVQRTESQLKSIKAAYNNYLAEFERTQSEAVDPQAISDYKQLREKFLMQAGHIESRLLELQEERQSVLNEIENADRQKELLTSRIQELSVSKNKVNTKLKDIDFQLSDILSSVNTNKSKLNELKTTRDQINKREFEVNSKLKQILIELNDLNAMQRESRREKQLRDNTIALKRLFPGVKGLLYDLCKPKQKKYELAVSTVLGKNFDAIIVDTVSTANECIDYLKEQRLGVASFIPLDTVVARPPNNNLRNINDKIRPTLDVVDYDSEFERAIQYSCGNSIICDTIEVAKHAKWDRKIDAKAVTLDGSLIHKSGLMTGGLTTNSGRRWDKSQIQRLSTQKEDLKQQAAEIAASKPSDLLDKKLMDEIDYLENQLPALRDSKSELMRNANDVDTEIRNQQRLLAEVEQSYQGLNSKLQDNAQLEQAKSELSKVQIVVYADFCQTYGLDNSTFGKQVEFRIRKIGRIYK